MGIRFAKKSVALEGSVAVEEAEALAEWLRRNPRCVVKVAKAGHLHASVLQVLLALRPRLDGAPSDPWLRSVLSRLA
jgi:hypothetical protein